MDEVEPHSTDKRSNGGWPLPSAFNRWFHSTQKKWMSALSSYRIGPFRLNISISILRVLQVVKPVNLFNLDEISVTRFHYEFKWLAGNFVVKDNYIYNFRHSLWKFNRLEFQCIGLMIIDVEC